MSDSAKLPRVDFDSTETVGSTRWMRLETLSYHVADENSTDGSGSSVRKWDRAVRTTKQSEDSIDAVVILAILRHDPNDISRDEIVCVKQFRPPLDAYTIELPAGLIDAGEEPANAAVREFQEETGYIGKVLDVSPASYLSPGLTNESACLVRLEVDMTQEANLKNYENQNLHDGLEGCEKDRGLEKLMIPRVGMLNALHDMQQKEGVKVFAALYSLALGMQIGEGATCTEKDFFPLINLDDDQRDQVVPALRDSGFLIVKSSLLNLELQQKALAASARILEFSSKTVAHPSDPKQYMMLSFDDLGGEDLSEVSEDVRIGMDDAEFFSRQHNENNDSIRLLNYLRGDENTANRCKEHSDYGTLTLLLTDGVGGLEAFVDGKWRQVPYVEGALIVNIGSILSEWTRQDLKATLHRVAGPASIGSTTSTTDLLKAVSVQRRSIAYFADPNPNVATTLSKSNHHSLENEDNMTIDEYIQWRSGGTGADRSGVSFTSKEEERLA
eukprot:scaffold35_cov117-Skeletonema_dohrnii-CCMP3373.AAC.9